MNPKKFVALFLILPLLLCGCTQEPDPTETSGISASRMVQKITVSITPTDPNFNRVYTTRESLDALIQMLRTMQTDESPESTPDLKSGQTYYTIKAIYPNGRSATYYLLGYRYLQMGGEWCVVSSQNAMKFNEFLRTHPTEDGSEPTESPARTPDPTTPSELAMTD